METTTRTATVPASAGGLARRTTIGVTLGVVGVLVLAALVQVLGVDVGAAGPQNPFAAGPLVGSAIVAGIGAAIAYAVLARVTARPTRNFVVLAALVFVGMLLPVALVAPTFGVTPVGQAILVLAHAVVAVPLVASIVGLFGR